MAAMLVGRIAAASAAVMLALTIGVGGAQLLLQARSQVGAQPKPAAMNATPIVAVAASVTRDQAIALVRSLREVVRVDRIEAKLLPWSEFAPLDGSGPDRR